jgi:hypothetical protein
MNIIDRRVASPRGLSPNGDCPYCAALAREQGQSPCGDSPRSMK